jgi:hypothetical protein
MITASFLALFLLLGSAAIAQTTSPPGAAVGIAIPAMELINLPDLLLLECQQKGIKKSSNRTKDHNDEPITRLCYKHPDFTLWVIESGNPNLLIEAAKMTKDHPPLPKGLTFQWPKSRVLQVFGKPSKSSQNSIEYLDPESGYQRSVEIFFKNDRILKIVWSFEID